MKNSCRNRGLSTQMNYHFSASTKTAVMLGQLRVANFR